MRIRERQPEIIRGMSPGLKRVFVNAYEVTRHYGGPEEGGWWYDVGEPLASVPVRTPKDAIRTRHKLLKEFDEHNQGNISSVLGGSLLCVCYERNTAQLWPEERPRYW